MSYKNPKVPEGINVSDANPLVDLAAMLAAVTAILAVTLACLFFMASYVVKVIPFSAEAPIGEMMVSQMTGAAHCDPEAIAIEASLQLLADQLVLAQQIPEAITVRVHYLQVPEVNALATFGGHIFVMQGLIDSIPHENALSMVMAHEIAHVAHRDPIVATGRAAVVWLALSLLPGIGDIGTHQVISRMTSLTSMGFNRAQEAAADAAALETLQAYYGHATGAQALFEVLEAANPETPPAFLSTHPVNDERIAAVQAFQQANSSGRTQPIDRYRESAGSSAAAGCESNQEVKTL